MTEPTNDEFWIDLLVRDYECDMEGIVNNAVYLNYLEHARHQFLKRAGIDFADLTSRGIHPVVVRSEVDYKIALRSGDRFRVHVRVEPVSRLRVAFVQEIYRLSAGDTGTGDRPTGGEPETKDLAIQARIVAAVISGSGRPITPEQMHPHFAALIR